MCHFPTSSGPPPPGAVRDDRHIIKNLLPYPLAYKRRMALVLSFLIVAKVVDLGVLMVMKRLTDAMNVSLSDPHTPLIMPIGIIIGYRLLQLSTSLSSELREILSVKVTENSAHTLALQVSHHLYALSLHFHLERQTGGMSRDIRRSTRGIQSLISYPLYSTLPTLVEVDLVTMYFSVKYDVRFALTMPCTLASCIMFTMTMTSWRTYFRYKMSELDSHTNQKAIDSLLSFETVKYFGNEDYEARHYDENLKHYCATAIRLQNSLSVPNFGQRFIVATAFILILYRVTQGVAAGHMMLGNPMLVNTLMLQIYIPLNFLGIIYRELEQTVTDMDHTFNLLQANREVANKPGAPPLAVHAGEVRFAHIGFSYEANYQILSDVDFTIPVGMATAVVRQSGSGKSALMRLLFRLYDVKSGAIQTGDQDLHGITQSSVHAAIGIVPQDTVFFNDSIYYSITYGHPDVSREEVTETTRATQIHHFVEPLPDGCETQIGRRGLKLSGSEKQRATIARILFKHPPTPVLGKATSTLDSRTEHAIQEELICLAQNHTTLVVAHWLSTVVRVHQILVMECGRIIERGAYESLLCMEGRYAQMWCIQAREPERVAEEAEDARAD